MHLYLDIETIPGQTPGLRDDIARAITPPANYKKPETLAQWEAEQKPLLIDDAWRKTAFHGDRGELICIAWAVNDEPVQCVSRTLAPHNNGDDERGLLAAFFAEVSRALEAHHYRRPVFVGHNVRDFDLRFLYQRAVVLDLAPPLHFPHDARPNGESVFDTMTAWAGWGGRVSLDRLCAALGLAQKGSELGGEDIDGSKVWDYVRAGRIDEVVTYCKADVERVRAIHRRLTFAAAPMLLAAQAD